MTKRKPLTPPPPFDADAGTLPGGAYEHNALVARSLQDDEWKEFALAALDDLTALAADGLRYRAQSRTRAAGAAGAAREKSSRDKWGRAATLDAFRRRKPHDQDSEDWLAEHVEAWAAAPNPRFKQGTSPDKVSRMKRVRGWLYKAGEVPLF